MTSYRIVLTCSDAASIAYQDKLEAVSGCVISSHRPDGAGRMTLTLRPPVQLTKQRRAEILKAVLAVAPGARWVETVR